jgi:cell wall-associated NlpC family hydrolase
MSFLNVGQVIEPKLSKMQPGDIIIYHKKNGIGHVGIYIGNGKIVHASSKKTGIKISSYTYRPPLCVRRYW